jgi:sugar O-acyltransferase (sialic acid O-acetyltransferase NeuD family)
MGREVAQIGADMRADGSAVNVIGFLSDDSSTHGTSVAGLPVLGDHTFLEKQPGKFDVALAIGAPPAKLRVAARIRSLARGFPSLIHPSVARTPRVVMGAGVILSQRASLTVDISLGDFVLVNVACTIAHDCALADYVTLAPAVNLSGNVHVEEGCDIGTGVAVIQGIRIARWSIVGAGAVVTTDVPANCTAVGLPARPVKHRPEGWQLGREE